MRKRKKLLAGLLAVVMSAAILCASGMMVLATETEALEEMNTVTANDETEILDAVGQAEETVEVAAVEVIGETTVNGTPVFTQYYSSAGNVYLKVTYTDGTTETVCENENNRKLKNGQDFSVDFDVEGSLPSEDTAKRGTCTVEIRKGDEEKRLEQEVVIWNLGQNAQVFSGQAEKIEGQAEGEVLKFLLVCEKSGDYILRCQGIEDISGRIGMMLYGEEEYIGGATVAPFKGFTGSLEMYEEAGMAMYLESGKTYAVDVRYMSGGTDNVSYELYFGEKPAITDIYVDNESYIYEAGGHNWWGLNGFPFVVTYSDGSIQHVHGEQSFGAESGLYDDYGNYFEFKLKDESQELYDENDCLIGGEYPVVITVSDGQVYEDVIKIKEVATEPEAPAEPETPVQPENPGQSETPTEPGTPVEPEAPETPDNPDIPADSETPAAPETAPTPAPSAPPVESDHVLENGEEVRMVTVAGNSNIYIVGNPDYIPTGVRFSSDLLESGEIFTNAANAVQRYIGANTNFKVYEMNLWNAANELIHQLGGKINVTLPLPAGMAIGEGKTIVVYSLRSDGSLEKHDTVVKDNLITFATDHFSTYIVIEQDAALVVSSPKTGEDFNMLPYMLLFISIVGVVMAAYVKRKQFL